MPDQNRSGTLLEIALPLMTLKVMAYVYTGTDPQTRPGVGISIATTVENLPIRRVADDGTVYFDIPVGVLGRDQVRAIRNLFTDFVLDFPEEEL